MNNVYQPAEDTLLLLDALERLNGRIFRRTLEIGSGRGLVTEALSKISLEVYTIDISIKAVHHTWRRLKSRGYGNISHAIQGDMLSMIRSDNLFDLIVSNPPYLPSEGLGDKTIEGGLDFIKRLINESVNRIAGKGILMLVVSTYTGDIEELLHYIAEKGLTPNIKLSRKLFFEELVLIEAVKT